MTARRPLVAGNWKMNGLRASFGEFDRMLAGYRDAQLAPFCDLLVCPPATLVQAFAWEAEGLGILIGGQDCHPEPAGAHTGDISAEMLRDAGASAVIVGHSERRANHGESDALVRKKAQAAWRAGLFAIVCIGETQAERDGGRTEAVVRTQLSGSVPDGATATNLVIAYEPVWAIGTGRTPTGSEVTDVHRLIRSGLVERFGAGAAATRILYGGSVKPDNAELLLRAAEVDGALIGGASLKAKDFLAIASVYRAH